MDKDGDIPESSLNNDKCDANKKGVVKRAGNKRKHFMHVYRSVMGNVSKTCEQVGLSRQSFYRWYEGDVKFRLCVDEVDQSLVDFAESKLKEQIDKGNMIAIIFFLTNRSSERWKDKRAASVTQHQNFIGRKIGFTEEERQFQNEMMSKLRESERECGGAEYEREEKLIAEIYEKRSRRMLEKHTS